MGGWVEERPPWVVLNWGMILYRTHPSIFSIIFSTTSAFHVLSGFPDTYLTVAGFGAIKALLRRFGAGRAMSLSQENRELMRLLADRNHANCAADLSSDYDAVTPPPHDVPFNNIKAVWGVQPSGRNGFVIDESELPY